jgi:hypothetical protein
MRNIFSTVVLLLLALILSSCSTCNDCYNDLSTRYRMVDSTRNELFKDINLIEVKDLDGNLYLTEREVLDTDTFYVTNLSALSIELEKPDTILIIYNNMLIDSVNVGYSFSSDSRCCTNTLKVGSMQFFNRGAAKRIKPLYYIYDIVID